MKKVQILCVGKVKENYIVAGIEEYLKRLKKFCDFSIVEIKDSKIPETAIKTESAEILKKMYGFTILLDIDGNQLSSVNLSQLLEKTYTLGYDTITFIIGGSMGVSNEVKQKVDYKLSFGLNTYPHQLFRLILIEQIYRAFNISENTPYHK